MIALLANLRSGTNFLRSALAKEDWCEVAGEVFGQKTALSNPASFHGFLRRNPVDVYSAENAQNLLQRYWASVSMSGRCFLADIKDPHIRFLDWPPFPVGFPPAVLQSLKTHRIPIIRCTRRNKLAQFLSLELALERGVWKASTAEGLTVSRRHFHPPVVLDVIERLLAADRQIAQWIGDYDRVLWVTYEDLISDGKLAPGFISALEKLLNQGLTRGQTGTTIRLSPHISEQVSNLIELKEALDRTPYAWMMDELLNAEKEPATERPKA